MTNVPGELTETEVALLRRAYDALHTLSASCSSPGVRAASRQAVAELYAALDGEGLEFDYYTHRWAESDIPQTQAS
jgi:Family of unknown function (DUF6052)